MIEIQSHRATTAFVRRAGAGALVALAFAFPASAGAQERDCEGPTGDQYCPDTEVLTATAAGGDPQDPGTGEGLPFTGLDLALTLAAGAGMLGAGVALRRASRERSAAE